MNFRFSAADGTETPVRVSTANVVVDLQKASDVYETSEPDVAAALRQVPSLQELKPEVDEADPAPAPVPTKPNPEPAPVVPETTEAPAASKEATQ